MSRVIRSGSTKQESRRDYEYLAEVGRARLTQIMNLLLLAPDIQEEIHFLPLTNDGQDPISDRDKRPIVAEPNWEKPREMWKQLRNHRF